MRLDLSDTIEWFELILKRWISFVQGKTRFYNFEFKQNIKRCNKLSVHIFGAQLHNSNIALGTSTVMLPSILVSEINTDNESITREVVVIREFPDNDAKHDNENIADVDVTTTTSASVSLEEYANDSFDEEKVAPPSSFNPQIYIYFVFGDEVEGFWSDDDENDSLSEFMTAVEISISEENCSKLLTSLKEFGKCYEKSAEKTEKSYSSRGSYTSSTCIPRKSHQPPEKSCSSRGSYISSRKSHPISQSYSYNMVPLAEKHNDLLDLMPVRFSRSSSQYQRASELYLFPAKDDTSQQSSKPTVTGSSGVIRMTYDRRLSHNIGTSIITSDLRRRWSPFNIDTTMGNRSSKTSNISSLSSTTGIRLTKKLFPTGVLKGSVTIFHRKAEKYWKNFHRPYKGIHISENSSQISSVFNDLHISELSRAESELYDRSESI